MIPLLLVCPNCGNKTPHTAILRHNYVGEWYGSDGKPSENPPMSYYVAYACGTCNDMSVYTGFEHMESRDEEVLVFPTDVALDKSIPDAVAANYNESRRVQKVSPNAFAVLLRRALEALCDDRKAPEGTLHLRLKFLADKGEIPPVLAEMTSALRELGNSGAHNTEQKVTVPMTWQMDTFFRTVVEYVYVAPARLAEFKESVAKGKKAE